MRVVCVTRQGEISIASLGILNAQLYGCMMALLASLAVCCIGCFVAPMNFNWQIMLDGITLVPGDGARALDVCRTKAVVALPLRAVAYLV